MESRRQTREFSRVSTAQTSSLELRLARARDLLDLVVWEPGGARGEIATLKLHDLRSTYHSISFGPCPIPIEHPCVRETARLAPPQFVQNLSGGAAHRPPSRATVIRLAAQRPYQADRLRGRWTTRPGSGPSWTGRMPAKATRSSFMRKANRTRAPSCRTTVSAARTSSR